MKREINMYDPASPGACWVMECQKRFAAILITETLDYAFINWPIQPKHYRQMFAGYYAVICEYFFR